MAQGRISPVLDAADPRSVEPPEIGDPLSVTVGEVRRHQARNGLGLSDPLGPVRDHPLRQLAHGDVPPSRLHRCLDGRAHGESVGARREDAMKTSWQVATAAEAFAAAQFARCGWDVSVQYGANQPEYDLVAVNGDRVLKVSVKGSKDGGWGLTQSFISNADPTNQENASVVAGFRGGP